ncbi:MAG: hypothetical protein ACI9CF_000198 [Candidatus Omnitrophota bacterium]|jgi:hypothetical protein
MHMKNLNICQFGLILFVCVGFSMYGQNVFAGIDKLPESHSELKAITNGETGTNVRGESTQFNDYLNDDRYKVKDGDIRIMKFDDPDQSVVLGAEDAPAGVSYKMGFEETPLEKTILQS